MTLPHNPEIERAILSAILIDHEKLGECQEADVRPEYFFNTKHQVVYEALPKVVAQFGMVDSITLTEYLFENTIQGTIAADHTPRQERDKKLIHFVDALYVDGLVGELPNLANFVSWVTILKRLFAARQFAAHCNDQYQRVCEQPSTINELIEATASWVINMNQRSDSTLKSVEVLAHQAYESMEANRRGEVPAGLPVGIPELDCIYSMRPGTMNVLAARPAMGKSALALLAAYHNASNGIGTLIFSLEMGNEEMTKRLIAMHGGINTRAYENDRSHVSQDELRNKAIEVSQLPIWIEEAAPIDINRIRATSRRMMLRQSIGLIVIDYIQLADVENQKASREQAIGEISRNCKLMARELDIPILALAQLNREVERREPPRPRLSDLRDSGTLEQDADTVLFLSPETKDEKGQYMPGGKMNLDIAKHRGGPIGSTPIFFNKQHVKFETYRGDGRL